MITDEIAVHDLYKIVQQEGDRKKLIGNIAFCQLGVMAETMNIFQINQELTTEIITKFAPRFDLSSADIEVLLLTVTGKKEKEVSRVLTVQRGIPAWLQELEGAAHAISKRTPKPLSEYLNHDKND